MPASGSFTYTARQPIVDHERCVVGYELLFRDAPEATGAVIAGSGTGATASLLANSVLVDGVQSLVGEHRAWVNFPEELLIEGIAELLSPRQFVIEVLEDVRPTEQVLDRCRRLRLRGYQVALDDVVDADRLQEFAGCFDIVKVDWLAAPADAIAPIVAAGRAAGSVLLAEKLESEADLASAAAAGFSLFQGYAIGLPAQLQRRNIQSLPEHTIRLLQLVNSRHFDYGRAESIIRSDPGLTFKILAFANSALAAQRTRVTSLKQALVLFGEQNLRRAVLLVFLGQVATTAPAFALVEALAAGIFCDALAHASGCADIAAVCAFAATLSHMDRLLGVSMTEVLERLPVDTTVHAALLDGAGAVGEFVRLTRAFQRGDWAATDALVRQLGVPLQALQPRYKEALTQAERLLAPAGGSVPAAV